MRTLGVILARGGSKRLPNKNIKLLNGHPLIYYTILTAQRSNLTSVVVSSDSDEILSISRKFHIPCIKRPDHLAQDDTPSFLALKHAVEKAEETFGKNFYDKVVLLQPTSPTRTNEMINRCLQIDSDAVITISPLLSGKNATFIENGAVYVMKRSLFDKIKNPSDYLINDLQMFKLCCVTTETCIDIDTEEEFKEVEKVII